MNKKRKDLKERKKLDINLESFRILSFHNESVSNFILNFLSQMGKGEVEKMMG